MFCDLVQLAVLKNVKNNSVEALFLVKKNENSFTGIFDVFLGIKKVFDTKFVLLQSEKLSDWTVEARPFSHSFVLIH